MVEVITTDNFEEKVLKSETPVLVDFYADWCGPCKMMAPAVAAVAEKYAGRLLVGKLNVDENMEIAMQYRVASIPCMILYKGGAVVDQVIGAVPQAQLEKAIEKGL